MELLRRALLVGCVLPAVWLLRLATLDPLVSVVSLEPGIRQEQGGNDSAYVSGQSWDRFLLDIDALDQGLGPQSRWRVGVDVPPAGGVARWVFFRPDEIPAGGLGGQLAASGGAATVSISRPDGRLRYQLDRRDWTRQEFSPGAGFTGKPVPPASLLYPFQYVGYACFLLGIALFALTPSATKVRTALSPGEIGSLAAALLLFAAPLVATGGSVQALTRGLPLTLPCWIFAGIAVHLFARPDLSAPRSIFQLAATEPGAGRFAALRLPVVSRWQLSMLVVAIGPLAILVSASLTIWNR
jgi:hypothetical protein